MSDKLPHNRYVEKLSLGSSHVWAMEYCASLLKEKKDLTVLDIGPGSGVMGRWFKSNGLEISNISAVEIDASTRLSLKDTYSHIVPELSYLDRSSKFDIILLLDVLEHMPDPDNFIKELKNFTQPYTKILISLPNITHWAVRMMFILGYFEPMERGPLDRTHLQFYSRNRFLNFINNIKGTKVLSLASSITPLELILPKLFVNNPLFTHFTNIRILLANTWPALFAYQYLAVISVKDDDKNQI